MRKVLVYWSIILIVLIAGTVAIVHGKLLLKEEIKQCERIKEELSLSKTSSPPVILKAESYTSPEKIKMPELSKVTANQTGPLIPYAQRIPITQKAP